jgi:DNA repair exonuclease SbcCD ATPase subunit
MKNNCSGDVRIALALSMGVWVATVTGCSGSAPSESAIRRQIEVIYQNCQPVSVHNFEKIDDISQPDGSHRVAVQYTLRLAPIPENQAALRRWEEEYAANEPQYKILEEKIQALKEAIAVIKKTHSEKKEALKKAEAELERSDSPYKQQLRAKESELRLYEEFEEKKTKTRRQNRREREQEQMKISVSRREHVNLEIKRLKDIYYAEVKGIAAEIDVLQQRMKQAEASLDQYISSDENRRIMTVHNYTTDHLKSHMLATLNLHCKIDKSLFEMSRMPEFFAQMEAKAFSSTVEKNYSANIDVIKINGDWVLRTLL